MWKDTRIVVMEELQDLPVIQEGILTRDQGTATLLEDMMITEKTDMRKVTQAMKTEETEETKVTAETEETMTGLETEKDSSSIMATAGQALEGAAGRL